MPMSTLVIELVQSAARRRGDADGTWDAGPFDNDCAADWCDELARAEPGERSEMIRHSAVLLARFAASPVASKVNSPLVFAVRCFCTALLATFHAPRGKR
ncbi:DUF4259 domain-containing protein [Nocardia sp. XZ_19_369]|uniref:DUF4259 domain-containing protein n=1 Tax=Nocardia sp. XZ_19_369 TaxID=2769487 RepID=UPI0035A34850